MHRPTSKRLWLIPLILITIGVAAYFSVQNRQRLPSDTVTLGDGRPKLIEFGMGVCKQCRRMKPVMKKLEEEFRGLADAYILDVRQEENQKLAEQYNMIAMPYVVLLDGSGYLLWEHTGFIDYDNLSKRLKEHVAPQKDCASYENVCQPPH